MNSLVDLWDAVCAQMKENKFISEPGFNTWLKDSYIMDYKDGFIYISVPTPLHKEIVENTYDEKLRICFKSIIGTVVNLEFVVNIDEDRGNKLEKIETPPSKFIVGANFTFDNFILGPSNRYAHAAAMAVAEHPSMSQYNPLLIYGASGVGKTHLMFAIRNRIAQKYPDKHIEYICCEDFTNMYVEALQSGTINLFHSRFRNADVLLIDDIQFIDNKEQTQEELFNTFNSLMLYNKQVVLTSDRPPRDINSLDTRLRSRFESGTLSDIATPDLETRIGITKSKARTLNLNLSDDVIYYISEQLKTNIRQIEGVLNQISAYENLHKVNPSMSIIQSYIRMIINDSKPDPINIDRIISEVSHYMEINEADIRSKRRRADIVWARHVCMYVASTLTNISNMQIAKYFKMDHTSVGYALEKTRDRLKLDSYENRKVNEIMENLKKFR